MAEKTKRRTTKYKGIYYNERTKKYDIKYNYKVYNVLSGRNDYKSKWVYNIRTLTEARQELAQMQAGDVKTADSDITLKGALELWLIKAQGQNFSPVSIRNTRSYVRMISQFLPEDTKIKDISDDVYYKFCADCRNYGYSEETQTTLNITLRKLIHMTYKKRLISENILNYADNMKMRKKEEYRVISKEHFMKLDQYFDCVRIWKGTDIYYRYRLLYNLLYYTGIRIGEALALTWVDFEVGDYTRIRIEKSYVSDIDLVKEPKNYKHRIVPLPSAPRAIYSKAREAYEESGERADTRVFKQSYSSVNKMLSNACDQLSLPLYNCHDFRHTYISNLIKDGVPLPVIERVSGDTQTTILKRYSHVFENDEVAVLKTLENL
ncbi:MAG: site-specific integrase [Lachnospiraceae bacterium]|nr:site-specific integrase [Lachnospiraceae bacterium]